AFGPDGREELASLCRAVEELRGAGACRVVYEPSRHVRADLLAHQVRVGPDEIAAAYAIGAADGFAPLSTAIERVGRQVGEVAPAPMAAWFRDYLGRVDEALANADPGVVGMGRERFKRDVIDVADALAAAAAISAGIDAWERMLSERIFGRSKRLSA